MQDFARFCKILQDFARCLSTETICEIIKEFLKEFLRICIIFGCKNLKFLKFVLKDFRDLLWDFYNLVKIFYIFKILRDVLGFLKVSQDVLPGSTRFLE